MSCGHGARFRTGRNFLFCYFFFFFHALSSTSNLLDWPKHVFSFLPRKGIEKGMDNIHSDVRVDILSLIVWTQIGSKRSVVALLNCPGKCAARLKLQFSATSRLIFSAHKSASYAGWSHFSIIKNCLNFKMTNKQRKNKLEKDKGDQKWRRINTTMTNLKTLCFIFMIKRPIKILKSHCVNSRR